MVLQESFPSQRSRVRTPLAALDYKVLKISGFSIVRRFFLSLLFLLPQTPKWWFGVFLSVVWGGVWDSLWGESHGSVLLEAFPKFGYFRLLPGY